MEEWKGWWEGRVLEAPDPELIPAASPAPPPTPPPHYSKQNNKEPTLWKAPNSSVTTDLMYLRGHRFKPSM